MGITKAILQFLNLYFTAVSISVRYVFQPLELLVRGYSETAGEGISQLSRITRNTLVILPVVLLCVVGGIIITQASSPTLSDILGVNIEYLLASVFGLSSIFATIVMYQALDESEKDSIFTGLLLLLAMIGVLYFSEPKLYAFLLVVAYGMGSYVIDRIEVENPYPADYLNDELETTGGVLRNGIGFSVVVCLGILGMTDYNPYLSETVFLAILLLTTAVSYMIPKSQRKFYENIYKHTSLKTSSQFWILTSKAGVLLSFGVALIDGQVSVLTGLGLLTPAIVSLLFTAYIRYQKSDTIMGIVYTDSDNYADPLYISSNKQIDIDKSINGETAHLDVDVNISIPEDLPEKSVAWQEFIKSTHKTYELISGMCVADNTGDLRGIKDEFDSYYDDVAYQYYVNNHEDTSDVPVKGWDDRLINRIRSQIYRSDNADLQDIYDLDLRKTEKRSDEEYINISK